MRQKGEHRYMGWVNYVGASGRNLVLIPWAAGHLDARTRSLEVRQLSFLSSTRPPGAAYLPSAHLLFLLLVLGALWL